MFGWEEQIISQWFLQMAYQPLSVYLMVVVLMFASSFGLPLPEEVTIIASSLTAYIAVHSTKYPPPVENAVGVDPYLLALVCFLSVFISDYLIYWIGGHFGVYLKSHSVFGRTFRKKSFKRVESWVHKYGILAPCLFRFTPGLRFPGHLMCGIIHFPPWKFALIVGLFSPVNSSHSGFVNQLLWGGYPGASR